MTTIHLPRETSHPLMRKSTLAPLAAVIGLAFFATAVSAADFTIAAPLLDRAHARQRQRPDRYRDDDRRADDRRRGRGRDHHRQRRHAEQPRYDLADRYRSRHPRQHRRGQPDGEQRQRHQRYRADADGEWRRDPDESAGRQRDAQKLRPDDLAQSVRRRIAGGRLQRDHVRRQPRQQLCRWPDKSDRGRCRSARCQRGGLQRRHDPFDDDHRQQQRRHRSPEQQRRPDHQRHDRPGRRGPPRHHRRRDRCHGELHGQHHEPRRRTDPGRQRIRPQLRRIQRSSVGHGHQRRNPRRQRRHWRR